ncbi:MAG: 50S ribosomal protein L4 [Planctomycetes bacterium]|nr:50S ribosomal protein L4 [Planctomycetota bacterium]
MADVKVYSDGSVSLQAVDPSRFGDKVLGRTLKDAVVMYEANVRAGTAKAKTRGEVAGPNKKLWKQKHTGRARMGSKKVPHWRGGGVAFGPTPRDYSYHMPKRARRTALRNAIYTKFLDGEVAVASGWPAGEPSTKTAYAILRALEVESSALVVTRELDPVLHMSLRNVPHVDVRPLADLNAREVLLRRFMVLTPDAMQELERRYGAAETANVEA